MISDPELRKSFNGITKRLQDQALKYKEDGNAYQAEGQFLLAAIVRSRATALLDVAIAINSEITGDIDE